MEFEQFFRTVTGHEKPYDYQVRLAREPFCSRLVVVPTGTGKTAAVIVAWLWRLTRGYADVSRRLVYCLPMRTLVEQTKLAAQDYVTKAGIDVGIYTLMGGEIDEDWVKDPKQPAMVIGTQDLIISRMLNRGYAANPLRWPLLFGLIANDATWVLDEIQLFGSGLATSLQLQSFRERMGAYGACHAIWMSATAREEWLETVDRQPKGEGSVLKLTDEDRADERLRRRLNAVKVLERAPNSCLTPEGIAVFTSERHQPGTITLVVVNTVRRAREVYTALKGRGPSEARANVKLMHSRFRGTERREWQQWFAKGDMILVATQVVEAGLDLSAAMMVTDLAPWPSLVQRFGRVNRDGGLAEARIHWIDPPAPKQPADSRPYEWRALESARKKLEGMKSASPGTLPVVDEPFEFEHVLRKRDVLDLFDTAPDLGGSNLDISRFVRGGEDHDVFVAWRDWENSDGPPPKESPRIQHDELCPAPIHEVTELLKKRQGWIWRAGEGEWAKVDSKLMAPGMRILLHGNAGGYDERGWSPSSTARVEPVNPRRHDPEDSAEDDGLTFRKYRQTLTAHTNRVVEETERLLSELGSSLNGRAQALRRAARWHDWGKALYAFQHTLHGYAAGPYTQVMGKSCGRRRHQKRPHLIHELASALGLLANGETDLVAYLVAAHHGRIRVNVRSHADERRGRVRGIENRDPLPDVDLGGETRMPECTLSLGVLQIGSNETGSRSWADRALSLRDEMGPFRLAYLEALLRVADERASADPGKESAKCPE